MFQKELDFEKALVTLLFEKGWKKEVIVNPTEEDLILNWADILFHNNQGKDRLNGHPLTKGEMAQILDQIKTLKTPLKLNGFINGKTVSIKRDNENDTLHFGKEVSLKIYDPKEISAGQSFYQIVRQPQFKARNKILPSRRGDVMLLINGMPMYHLELKKSGVPVSQAYHQIEKYVSEGVFSGLFSLVQVFFAMTPEETVYFANLGEDKKFNPDYYFHWADFDNEPMDDYKRIVDDVLPIHMAHQIIGFYTIPDQSDGVLKVMRSYQYFASNAISDKVFKINNACDWGKKNQRGGFIWHTTGSGKTMTSFKSAHLIASSGDADKVVFLTDRIELGTQSLKEYQGFAGDEDSVQATENTHILISRLKSKETADTLIVTSIQKMSNIHQGTEEEPSKTINDRDILAIQEKRLVFIVDECHRSTFGLMLNTIKRTFPHALFFGFTGTPIQDENQKKESTTADIFGDELHRYSIADGIRDKNVLGFDPYQVLTFQDYDVRIAVALEKAKAQSETEALSDETKKKVFQKYMAMPMCRTVDENGKETAGIEDYMKSIQYQSSAHTQAVAEDIVKKFVVLSQNRKFHGIFATSSIPEAIQYYRLIKNLAPDLQITGLFDPNIDNNGNSSVKSDGLVEIYEDYNEMFGTDFTLTTAHLFKKDIASRLAHKDHYRGLEKTPEKQIDLLIVVDQMLTGFDSKWINTLYLDKTLEYANMIQAFSRTNRLFGPDKPFGTIRYYRKPHTMKQNVEKAVKLYSGDKPVLLFVDKLQKNLENMNRVSRDIQTLFKNANVLNMERLPDEPAEKREFSKLFGEFNQYFEAAKLQGFHWSEEFYIFDQGLESEYVEKSELDENTFLILASRYKELSSDSEGNGENEDVPYDLVSHLSQIDTGKIDADYMNHNFTKYLKLKNLDSGDPEKAKILEETLNQLHKTFANLNQEEQKFAGIILRDVQEGTLIPEDGKTMRDYITEYQVQSHDDQISRVAAAFGVDEGTLRKLTALGLNKNNIDEFGRFTTLREQVDKEKAKAFLEEQEGKKIPPPKVNIKVDKILREFIIEGGKKFPYFQPEEVKEGF